MLRSLLTEGRDADVVELFTKLVSRNGELEIRLAQLLSRGHKNEGVSGAQLRLFLEVLTAQSTEGEASVTGSEALGAANDKLREASGIDAKLAGDAASGEQNRPAKQPPLRRAVPLHLARIDNPIPVPPDQRACPKCGVERECIGHDVTEVIELIPARVVVRVDRREKLACKPCVHGRGRCDARAAYEDPWLRKPDRNFGDRRSTESLTTPRHRIRCYALCP